MGLLWWGVCFGRLGREAGGTSSRKWRGEGGESLYCRASCHCANVRNQVWWWSKLRILSSQPYLVTAVPGQRVQIAEKVRLFQVFLDEWVKCGECRFVSLWDESCGAHLKAVHCAVISCDVCDEWCVFTWFLKVPLLHVAGKRNSQLKYVQFLLCVINNDYVRLQICYTELSRDGSSSCGFPAWQVTVYFESWVHIAHNEVD